MSTETARVRIRPPNHTDGPELVALRRESRAFLEQWEPVAPPGVDAFGPSWFERFIANAHTDKTRRFLIVDGPEGTIVGQVGLNEIIRGPLQQAFLGYWVGSPHARRGFASAAIPLVLDEAFGALALSRIEANVMPRNVASRGVLEKVGFRQEGVSLRYLEIAGVREDHERWATTREEWLERRAAG